MINHNLQDANPDAQTIDIVDSSASPSGTWMPVVGEETLDLLEYLKLPDDESRDLIKQEAVSILSRCVSPIAPESYTTGLVMGYVQSGKTMSFTIVAALASDNNIPLIIVIAGTSKPLYRQSRDRLAKDLRLADGGRKWKQYSNPTITDRQSIESSLSEWRDQTISRKSCQTILITVMKNHRHLNKLNELINDLDLSITPILIIDDEADQAGLNTLVKKGDQSTTYQKIVELRDSVPHHSFLQYTATPQGPLLINVIDILSPKFVEILTPGKNYTGGKVFFADDTKFVNVIPEDEIPSKDNKLDGAPESLRFAMVLFFIGVAASYIINDRPKGNRSMMIHPSQRTIPHTDYTRWVGSVKSIWLDILGESNSDPDYIDLRNYFELAYNDLSETVSDIPSFDDIISKTSRAINKTIITEVNSTSSNGTPEINWSNDYSHILVGGQAMDRGFTVEGLTITYMPRNAGLGNADTVQQRARFFGYKGDYIGYCRVFIEERARNAFNSYVKHEESIRSSLKSYQETNKPLSQWKRAFFIDKNLRPTRSNIIDIEYVRDIYSDKWYQQLSPHIPEKNIDYNRKVINNFLDRLLITKYHYSNEMLPSHQHRVAKDISLRAVFEDLLLQIHIAKPEESQTFTGICMQIGQYLDDNPDAVCTVYDMSKEERGDREVGQNNKISGLFQGAYPAKPPYKYPGDRLLHEDDQLTVQIHHVNIKDGDKKINNIVAIALWIPQIMANAWLVQDQGGHSESTDY